MDNPTYKRMRVKLEFVVEYKEPIAGLAESGIYPGPVPPMPIFEMAEGALERGSWMLLQDLPKVVPGLSNLDLRLLPEPVPPKARQPRRATPMKRGAS